MKPRNLIRLAKLSADESGAAAVEFAIVSSVFITFVIGLAYAAIMLHSNAALQWAVETTARRAAIDPNVTQTDLETAVNALLTQNRMPNASVSYSVANVGTVPVATLTATFNRTFTIPFVATFNTTYTATAQTPQNADS
jgi:Flp pilus assembly protein TadG